MTTHLRLVPILALSLLQAPAWAQQSDADANPDATPFILSGNDFNPALSVILDGIYGTFSRETEAPAGFGEEHEEEGGNHGDQEHGHGIEEGFQLRETEVAISGSIDPYLDGSVTAAIGDEGVELEEAYVLTTALPAGFQIKAGKFLSDVGYINPQHPHSWDFVDQPWMREFMFGDEGLNETGVQFSWVAPTAQYTRLGLEVLEGENEGVANHLGDSEPGLEASAGPRLVTAFAKFSPDLGYDHALQMGVSGGFTDAFQQRHEHEGDVETLQGDSWFAGVDTVYKYDAQGPGGRGDFKLQAEYLIRARDLHFQEYEPNSNNDGFSAVEPSRTLRPKQDGAYVQGLYGIANRWDAGLRMDALGMANKVFDGAEREEAGTSFRYTGQVSYSPSEFSRFRAQLAYLDPDQGHSDHDDGHSENAWQLMLQYNLSLGAHGAHRF